MNSEHLLKNFFILSCLFLFSVVLFSCNQTPDYTTAPLLTGKQAIKKMEIEEGFKVQLVAEEPLLNSPTNMIFDEKGRIWVVEMPSYMLDTAGTNEEAASGQVIILEDKDGDGEFEDRKVFMKDLVLPRAISFVENGILIAEPPNLWFVEIENDLPGKKTLVDSAYAIGGNVEHQPNGLVRALDNWIYNAKSDKRYRKKGENWRIEKTHYRGQWGLAQDDFGRLYYNHNSANVLGDYFPPGLGASNTNQPHVNGYNETIVKDNRVYPSRPTTGVNRGYMEGILDSNARLVEFTAASGLTIYRGDIFPEEYLGNAFVPEPAAFLIKRNLLRVQGNQVEGEQAYEGKEFLRSVDERFRPVSLSNGPDGALYIVDMHRGIIQHKTYLTDYLKSEIMTRGLEKETEVGRIYKVFPKNAPLKPVDFPEQPLRLLPLLGHQNGWVRDKAQQLLVDKKDLSVVPELKKFLNHKESPLLVIHALWTLEGLGALSASDLLPLLTRETPLTLRMQALTASASILSPENSSLLGDAYFSLINQQEELIAPYLAFNLTAYSKINKEAADNLSMELAKAFPNNQWVASGILSAKQNQEADFLKKVQGVGIEQESQLVQNTRAVLKHIEKRKSDRNTRAAAEKFPKGALIYQSTCATCHGKDGYGLESLAPLLNGSDWVTGPKGKVIATVLYGLSGPIVVNGKVPKVSGDMPGIGQNPEFDDQDIAEVISFIRNAWSNSAGEVKEADVQEIRTKFKDKKGSFTMSEIESHWK